MKGFWKWLLIVLGVLALAAISFLVAFMLFRGVHARSAGYLMPGAFGGMMVGMGILMFLRLVIPLAILVLAGFGIAYLVKRDRKVVAPTKVCASCGKPLAAEWTTCPYCGTKVEAPTSSPQ